MPNTSSVRRKGFPSSCMGAAERPLLAIAKDYGDETPDHTRLTREEARIYKIYCDSPPEERERCGFWSSRGIASRNLSVQNLIACGLIEAKCFRSYVDNEPTESELAEIEAKKREIREDHFRAMAQWKPSDYSTCRGSRRYTSFILKYCKTVEPRPTSWQAAAAPIPEGADADTSEAG
jgi:hypothetical protein